jgi:signal transduction histidine kinase/CheY-like chemotaxis protein
VKLRFYILALLLLFGLAPLIIAVLINLPLVLDRTALFYQKAYLQNLRADFRDLDQHLASRHEMIRMLTKLPEPGVILGDQGSEDEIDLARARYTGWINQMLADQGDLIELLFLDTRGNERFWLRRDAETMKWQPTAAPPEPASRGFVGAGLKLQPGEVMVSRIRINPFAASLDPRQLMTLRLLSPIGSGSASDNRRLGLLLMTIDVGGLAQFYRDTLWVNHNGSYVRPGEPLSDAPEAFSDFPGLAQIFAEGNLALWKAPDGQPFLWVPMFLTENALPLWVGRPVDPSPIAQFRDALMLRVLSIILVLVMVVLLIARWLASRAERFGQQITGGVQGILRGNEHVRFAWQGPREVRELGEQLTALAHSHAEHLAIERQHTRQLEQSNRYKSEFLANVSHELRTPLNSILLLSKLLASEESGLEGDQRRQAQIINEAGRDLRAMIDNVLDISRLEAGPVTVSLEWIELKGMVEELRTMMAPIFSDRGLALDIEIAPAAPVRIYNDRDKVRQILKNFLSNAAKFTERGGVIIRIETLAEAKTPVAISVIDTGIGIPKAKQEIIFDAFQQADGSTRRRYGGTGLGLSISRELARLLHGRIAVESTPGKGSGFTLYLPVALDPDELDAVEIIETQTDPVIAAAKPLTDEPDGGPGADTPSFAGHWALLVERDVQSLVSITAQLEQLGVRVQTAADGDEALETLQEEGDCSVLLLAVPVHHQQTCDTIGRIRSHADYRALPIVLLGLAVDDDQRRHCLAIGATDFLDKPVEERPLIELLSRIFAERADTNQRQTA